MRTIAESADIIGRQIESSRGRNLFYPGTVQFTGEMLESLGSLDKLQGEERDLLLHGAVEQVLCEFYRINQYFYFNASSRAELQALYAKLYHEASGHESFKRLEQEHQSRLKHWLVKYNPFAESLYAKGPSVLHPVACSEYEADLQAGILALDYSRLKQPILDIGCGMQFSLVRKLRAMGYAAEGIDRYASSVTYIKEADWLQFDPGRETWGTVVSHLAFSNHFVHHHLRKDGDFAAYAKKYRDILHALKPGGSFHYSPGLPFIESHLDRDCYRVESFETGIGRFRTTVVTRIK